MNRRRQRERERKKRNGFCWNNGERERCGKRLAFGEKWKNETKRKKETCVEQVALDSYHISLHYSFDFLNAAVPIFVNFFSFSP